MPISVWPILAIPYMQYLLDAFAWAWNCAYPKSLSPSPTKRRILRCRHIHHQTRILSIPFTSSHGWRGLFLPTCTKSPASSPSSPGFLLTPPTYDRRRTLTCIHQRRARDIFPTLLSTIVRAPLSLYILTKTRTEYLQWSPSLNIANVEPTSASSSTRQA